MLLFEVGEVVDQRYEITGPLGQGGMAQVFRAYDRILERSVALKVLRPHLTEMDRERFRREIKTLARLSHPGIVSIYDLGRGAHVYFAMELVEGGLLTDVGPLEADVGPLTAFLESAATVAETLAYVHTQGMVHRDLTPRNILMTTQGQPKVMDFGLVQLAEVSRQLTRTGFTLGTPQYMAPEQAKGGSIGPHTDLYALGAVLYKAATGVAPFEAENDQAVLYRHVYEELTPPLDLNPALPPDLSRLITRLLAKEAHARPASGYAVAEALKSVRAQVERGGTHTRLGGPGGHGRLAHGPVNPQGLQKVWQTDLSGGHRGGGPQWPAAVTAAEGFVLLGLRSEEVCVLRPADGGVHARFGADDEVNSAVTFHQGNLFFTSRDGALYALSWPSGRRLWSDEGAAAVGVTPYGADLLVSTRSGLERRTVAGERRWEHPAEGALSAPTVSKGNAYFVSRDGWLHCVDPATGEGRFKLELGTVAAPPAAHASRLLLPERSGDLHAFDVNTHEVLWTYDMEGPLWASPLVWEGRVFAASWAGVMRCLTLETGDDLWAVDVEGRVTAAPVVASGVLYVVTEEGRVLALDGRSGRILFCDEVSMSPVQASPLILNETLLVAALDGTVHAYR